LPDRNTSGARPPQALGSAISSTGGLDVEFLRFPRIAFVEAEARVTARARRAAEPDLAPRRRVRIINADRLLQQIVKEEAAGRQVAPIAALDPVVLDVGQELVLLAARKLLEAFAVAVAPLGGDCIEAPPPRVAHGRHV
jgi:hypothetical protein